MSSGDLQTQSQLMDKIYRYERYIFDLTRPFYLVGRDQMLNRVPVKPGQKVLEVGVGTARNLLKLAKQEPKAHYYGVDISKMMLEMAEKSSKKAGIPIELKLVLHQPEHYAEVFELKEKFDHVILSFCLTMIPDPLPVLRSALQSLKSGGTLHIADYYDQARVPSVLRKILKPMMGRYHVRYRPEPICHIASLPGKLELTPILLNVSYRLHYTAP